MLFTAISSYDDALIDDARVRLSARWGSIQFQSPIFDFDQTAYYRKQMGENLRKQFVAFEKLVDPAEVVNAKITSNQLEDGFAVEYADSGVERPVNIDPGYVTEAKLVLATTKDRDHRIYLDRGILAEITLFYQNHGWNSSRWTYPDYKTVECHEFLDQCRSFLRNQIHSSTGVSRDNLQTGL